MVPIRGTHFKAKLTMGLSVSLPSANSVMNLSQASFTQAGLSLSDEGETNVGPALDIGIDL